MRSTLVLAAVSILLLGACSESAPTPPGVGPRPPAALTSSAGTSTSSGRSAPGTASGSCSLLSGAEIIGVLGGSATVSPDDVKAGHPNCNVDLTGSVWGGNGGLEFQRGTYSVEDYRQIAASHPHVSGVGDDAVYYAAQKMITFERDGLVVDLYALTDDDTPAAVVLHDLVKLAQLAATHVVARNSPVSAGPS